MEKNLSNFLDKNFIALTNHEKGLIMGYIKNNYIAKKEVMSLLEKEKLTWANQSNQSIGYKSAESIELAFKEKFNVN